MKHWSEFASYRLEVEGVYSGGLSDKDDGGWYVVRSIMDQQEMPVQASWGMGWDHVSVSRKNRTPNWVEMEQVANIFFKADETAMQLHVPAQDHINHHPYCLHWWRPQGVPIPRPPAIFVGPT